MGFLTATVAIILPVLALVVLAVSVFRTVRGIRAKGWRRPGWWPFPAMVLAAIGCATWFIGIFSAGFDVKEMCAERGYRYDDAYRAENWREPSRWFPLHNRCSAEHDLVPAFVNPTLVVVAVLLLGCAVGAFAAVVIKRKNNREARH